MLGTFRKTRALRQELNCPKSSPNHVDCRTTGKRLIPVMLSTMISERRLAYPSDGNWDYQQGRRRSLNGTIGLRIPNEVIEKKCAQYQKNGKPTHRPKLLEDDDFSIVKRYQQEYRGIVQYYLLVYNVGRLNKLRWIAEQSLMRTLASKHQTSVAAQYAKYSATLWESLSSVWKSSASERTSFLLRRDLEEYP